MTMCAGGTKSTAAFPLQHWLRERATLLRYASIADLVADSNLLGCKTALIRGRRVAVQLGPSRVPEDGTSTILPVVGNYLPT